MAASISRCGLAQRWANFQNKLGALAIRHAKIELSRRAKGGSRGARLLLLLAHFGSEGVPQPILVDISQETLAEMIGTTRSRVSHFMNKFRKLGLISYNGKIEVHNSLLNAVLHDKPAIERDEPSGKV